jgi:hypothetical protein
MSSLPPTIKRPNGFNKSKPNGFDGVFDWRWITKGIQLIHPDTHITPMDFDGVVERCQQFLIVETKDCGVAVPSGQMHTLRALALERNKTVWVVWGKTRPEKMVWLRGRDATQDVTLNPALCKAYVAVWYRCANNSYSPSVQQLLTQAEALMGEGDPFDESDPLEEEEAEVYYDEDGDPFAD